MYYGFCRQEQSQHLSYFLIALRKRWRGDFLVGTRLVSFFFLIICISLCQSSLETFFSIIIKGREDDNIETIRKRFKVFLESSLPVINYYDAKGKVRKVIDSCASSLLFISWVPLVLRASHKFFFQIDAARPIEEVFETVKGIFGPKNEKVNHYVRLMSKLYMYKFHFVSKTKIGNHCLPC